ncbi:hypothetical protein L1987_45475 [Smallanthus sonchifolius]|uniref:Uncharacterized protein n=1 Tax=Smallanthus sonchifolius TaxID=185202 RepID=A0ACB9FWV7_9ASTR|nr:hypothetical protein L1987_45475 [Smallanthus sonchifolius]
MVCGNRTSSQQSIFKSVVDGLLSNLSIATPKINGFYAAATAPVVGSNTSTAYAIAQCVETVTPDGCKSCLQEAYVSISSCASDIIIDGRAVDLRCFMRYSGTPFFRNNQTTDITPFLRDGSSSNNGAIILGVDGGVGGLIFLLTLVLLWYLRSTRITPGITRGDHSNCLTDFNSNLQGSLYALIKLQGPKHYSYSDLKKATEDFIDENKLREGGFGDVYKATLDDEEIVAVKKLKMRNGRAKVGFENEILLISHIRHRNLLRLLGWSSDGSSLLLVLEYMPNGSLDKFLWDFGLARFHPEDQSHVITKFAGTLGYTAPEYILYGILSDKVDTFSFGIAWKLYENKKLVKLVDETMDVNQEEEKHMMKIIEIALLCTQSPVSKRPTMSEVVLMLPNDPSLGERQLTKPNFTDYSRRIHIGS